MNLLESLVDIDISYELSNSSAIKLIPELVELVSNDEDSLSDAQTARFMELAEATINGDVVEFDENDTAFIIGLYLIMES